LPSETSGQGWTRYAWSFPAALAAVAIGVLCWGAWVYGYDPNWLGGAYSWWRPFLSTNQDWTLVVTLGLLLGSLGSYWWPRRGDRIPIGLIAVVVLAPVAAILGTAAYVPCRGHLSTTGVTFWIFQLYVGQPPNMVYQTVGNPLAACGGTAPLALQLAQIVGLGATGIGAITAASVLWRKPLDRLQSRFATDVTIFTGLNELSIPLLKCLAVRPSGARRPRAIIVIEPDDKHPLLEEVKLPGVRVVIGAPDSPHILHPIISAVRGCALTHLYALSDKVSENEAVIEQAVLIIGSCKPSRDRQPHLVALIEDPRHADRWRADHSGNWYKRFEDAVSSAETTARSLVSQVLLEKPRHVLVCGDGTLTVPILIELARRAWDQAELVTALEAGRAVNPDLVPPDAPSVLPVEEVTLLDLRSHDIKREYLKSAPGPVLGSLPDLVEVAADWRAELQTRLDRLNPAEARETAVIITAGPPGSGVHEAGRIARLRPETPVFVLAALGDARSGAIFDLMHPFEPSLLVGGAVPEDTWTRLARHWHECYRLSHPVPPGDPKAPARLPWSDLSFFLKQDNILQLRSILIEVVRHGRKWLPAHLVPEGSFIELSDAQVAQIAEAEHRRWVVRRLAAGERGGNVVPWNDLSDQARTEQITYLRVQLSRLEAVGFMPVIPDDGPPGAEVCRFERVGLVRASRLTEPLSWTNYTGEEMRGRPGDWRIIDDAGNLRTATDRDFRASHEQTADGNWRRVGTYRAWRATETMVIRTKEGNATARPGDWVVQAPSGERWPVENDQFEWSYRMRLPDALPLPDQAGSPGTEAPAARAPAN
jgi:hypothetical protein